MSNVRQIPTLRFPEFNNEWKNKKLKDVVKVNQGLAILKSNRFSNKSENRLNYITIPYLEGKVNEYIENPNESVICYEDDVIVTRTGSGLGKIWTGNYGVFHNNFFKVLPKDENISKKFIYHYLKSQNIQNKMRQYAGVGAIPDLNHGDFYLLPFYLTSLKEQQKIASFLSSVDKKIKLLREKKDLLEEYKKGVMQQIFSQQIRFKDADGNDYPDWEDSKLGGLASIKTGKLDANAMIHNGKYRFYTCAKEYFFIDDYAFDTEALLISGNGANVGYIHYYSGKFNAYQRTYVLDDFNQNVFYLKYYLERYLSERIEREKKDGNTPYIVLSTLRDMNIRLPSLKEQTKIADFLSAIDDKIELMNSQLENTQNFKKGLLQQMFV